MSKAGARTFRARLEAGGPPPLKWVIIRIPLDVAEIWGKRGQLKVKGEINGWAFRTSLFPTGKGQHILMVNKRMQAGGGVCVGEVARFCLEPDTEERIVTVPGELKRALAEEPALRRWYDKLNYSMRKYISDWITQVKSSEARLRRTQQIAERLLATMEAERELPPVLQLALARNPRAREGWEGMTAAQRRGHLLGILGYRSPEARARRIAKAMQEAAELAERKRD